MSPELPDALTKFLATVEEYHKQAPHVKAYEEMRQLAEEADQVLGDPAARLWEEVLRAAPDDPAALHHLAIIRHGAGYRLHQQGAARAAEAADEWAQGVQYWARVVRHDEFWEGLRRSWQARVANSPARDLVAERLLKLDLKAVRARLPHHLLGLHAGLACEAAGANRKLARRHMGAILKSGFDAAAVRAARDRVYRSLVEDVEQLFKDLKVDQARAQVLAYLDLDPDYPPALADGLRVCRVECERLSVRDEKAPDLLRSLEKAKAWADHPALVEAARDEFPLATARADFYHAWGQFCFLRGNALSSDNKPAEARKLFKLAFAQAQEAVACAGSSGQNALGLLHRVCCDGAFAEVDDNKEKGKFPFAEELLEVGLRHEPGDPLLTAIRAYCCFWSGNEEGFQRDLARAASLNAAAPSDEATSLLTGLRWLAERGVTRARLDLWIHRAKEALEADNPDEALELLANTDRIQAGDAAVLYWRSLCHLKRGELDTAERTSASAVRSIGPDTDPNLRAQIELLQEKLRQWRMASQLRLGR